MFVEIYLCCKLNDGGIMDVVLIFCIGNFWYKYKGVEVLYFWVNVLCVKCWIWNVDWNWEKEKKNVKLVK